MQKDLPLKRSRIFTAYSAVQICLFAVFAVCKANTALCGRLSPAFLVFMAVLLIAAFWLVLKRIGDRGEEARFRLLLLLQSTASVYSFGLLISPTKSLFWLLLFGMVLYFLYHALNMPVDRRTRLIAALLGFLFATFIFFGFQLIRYKRLELIFYRPLDDLQAAQTRFYYISLAFFLTVCLCAFFSLALRWNASGEADNTVQKRGWAAGFALRTGLLLICWLPTLIVYYPGILTYDSVNELKQQLGLIALSNHHPIIHQLLIGLCLGIVRRLSSPNLGVAVYSVLQMLLLALTFSTCITFLIKLGTDRRLCMAAFLLYAVYPVNAFYSITMWKDVLFGAFTLLLMILLVRETRPPQESRAGAFWSAVLLVAVSFLFCTFRNNGYYAYLIGFPLFLLCQRKRWKRLLPVFAAAVLLVFAYQTLLFDVLHIERSSSGEALSVPLQQIASVVKERGEEIPEREKNILREIFPDLESLAEKYHPNISDPVKDPKVFDSKAFDRDPVRYFGCWLRLGLEHPLVYVESFLTLNYGYWYPDIAFWIVGDGEVEDIFDINFLQPQALREAYFAAFTEFSAEGPFSILFSAGLTAWLLMIAAALLYLKRRGSVASPMFVLLALWLTTLASPLFCEYRYIYGLTVSTPFFLALALGQSAPTTARTQTPASHPDEDHDAESVKISVDLSPRGVNIHRHAPAVCALGSCRRCGVLSAPWPGCRV